jgi:8-amino-7-oxononanoate synthase
VTSEFKRVLTPFSDRNGPFIVVEGRSHIQWSSNDYLGLAQHPNLIEAAQKTAQEVGIGAAGSRLLGGDSRYFHEFENNLAAWLGKPACLVFNSGYQMNVGLMSSFLSEKDIVLADKLIHASLIDGVKLSGATLMRYKHNDMGHLQMLLEKHRSDHQKCLIVTESVFSMDGDSADLKSLIDLKNRWDTQIMVDEAHGVGIYPNLYRNEIDFVIGTLGKAFGCAGGFVGCSTSFKEFFINHARNFMYSTAMPPMVISAAAAALVLIKDGKLGEQLQEKTQAFREACKGLSWPVLGSTHIVPIVMGDEDKTLTLAQALREKGHWCTAVRHPTVPKGKARLRISLSVLHTPELCHNLLESVEALGVSS